MKKNQTFKFNLTATLLAIFLPMMPIAKVAWFTKAAATVVVVATFTACNDSEIPPPEPDPPPQPPQPPQPPAPRDTIYTHNVRDMQYLRANILRMERIANNPASQRTTLQITVGALESLPVRFNYIERLLRLENARNTTEFNVTNFSIVPTGARDTLEFSDWERLFAIREVHGCPSVRPNERGNTFHVTPEDIAKFYEHGIGSENFNPILPITAKEIEIGNAVWTNANADKVRDALNDGNPLVVILRDDVPYKMFHNGKPIDARILECLGGRVIDRVPIISKNGEHLRLENFSDQLAAIMITQEKITSFGYSVAPTRHDKGELFFNPNFFNDITNKQFKIKNSSGDFCDPVILHMHINRGDILSESMFQQVNAGPNVGTGSFNILNQSFRITGISPRITTDGQRDIYILWTSGLGVAWDRGYFPNNLIMFSTCFLRNSSVIFHSIC